MNRLFRSSRNGDESDVPLVRLSEDLHPQIVRTFALVGEAIAGATHALLANDRELAKRVVEQDIIIDDIVDQLVFTVEERLLETAPLDVKGRRDLLILLRILPEIERNGDLAEHIARRAARGLGSEMSPRSRGLIERMGEVAATIWRAATDIISTARRGSVPSRRSTTSSTTCTCASPRADVGLDARPRGGRGGDGGSVLRALRGPLRKLGPPPVGRTAPTAQLEQRLGDLHRVQRRALAQIVAAHKERQPVARTSRRAECVPT